MKLLYIFPEEFSGRFAREYHVYRLAESLAAAGCEVTLVAAPSPQLSTPRQLQDLFGGSGSDRLKIIWVKREVSLGPWKIRSGRWFYRQVDRIIDGLKPEAIYTMHVKAADAMRVRRPSLPLVFEAHEIFADTYPEGSARHGKILEMENRVYRHARAIVAISSYLADNLKARFQIHVPIRVQHDGIDEAMLLDPSQMPEAHELIYAGSLQGWKGVPVAIEAMRLLPEFHLTLIGGEGKALELLKKDAPANITFLGWLPREALRPHLQKASIGLMPNLLEPRSALYTFPLKLLEYSAAGKGIVASRIPVFDQLNLGDWISLVPSNSAKALAEAVRSLGSRAFDRNAARAWAGQFLWRDQGAALKIFLESIFP